MRCLSMIALVCCFSVSNAQSRDEKVRNDRKQVEAGGFWIYNDVATGFDEAKRSGKPMLVTFRCIPCEECVKLDEELIHQDDRVRPLLDKFVRIRVISANGLDLAQFQFDFDQSFALMMLNADGTVYGRYGTRSHRTAWQDDVSIEGFAKALQGALQLHNVYPKNQSELVNKKKRLAPEFRVPEKFPSLEGKYGSQIDYSGNVAKSCIHCHQVGEAQRQFHRDRQEVAYPDNVLFPHPHPKSIGLILDPKECATVLRVEKESIAERAGFQAGDVINKLEGQPLLSIADVQWVLHGSGGNGGTMTAEITRSDKDQSLTLTLPRGWRRLDDISWRASTWELRRIALGGMKLNSLTTDERKSLGLGELEMALRVEHVGQFSPHDAAKRAGLLKGDIIVAFDGKADFRRETDVIAYSLWDRQPASKVDVDILRNGKHIKVAMPIAN